MAAAVGKAAVAAYGHGESGGGRGGGFLGPRVPAEVEAMARGVQEVGKETFRRLLKGPVVESLLDCESWRPHGYFHNVREKIEEPRSAGVSLKLGSKIENALAVWLGL